MRIALVTPQWLATTGGPSNYVARLRETLEQSGHVVDVVTTDDGPEAHRVASRSPRRELGLFATLRRLRPDVVHIHGRAHFIASAIAYRATNRSARVVFTFHTQPFIKTFLDGVSDPQPDYVGVRRRIATALFQRCDAITTVSTSIVDNLNRFYGLGLHDALTIPSAGRDRAASAERIQGLKDQFSLGQSWPIISSIGVFSWDWKVAGHLTSIRGLSILSTRYPNARLLIAGDGRYRSVLEDEVKRLSLQERVHFLGNVKHTEDVLATSDVYVHMAPHEGCPLAVIEAMFAGRPIVASNEGGTPEILRHGENARLCDQDPNNVAEEVARLLEDPAHARALARRARQDATAHLSWRSIGDQYDALFRDLHAARRS